MMNEATARRARGARDQHTRDPQASAERAAMLADVLEGLSREQKELSPKYFYDARGAALFDAITGLPEYYLTRAEQRLLARCAEPWLARHGARTLVELGPGSGDKTRRLLDALPRDGAYVPVDISAPYLQRIANELGESYPHLNIEPVRADIAQALPLQIRAHPAVVAFLGSTIGNFTAGAARALLRRVRGVLRAEDRFLLGVDLRKDGATIEAAYNDAQGVTAEFNLNMLRVLNRELHADFDLAGFRHHAFYDDAEGRIEMHLIAAAAQSVHIGGHTLHIAAGESIRTEISAKYTRSGVRELLASADLGLNEWVVDEAGYALCLAAPGGAEGAA